MTDDPVPTPRKIIPIHEAFGHGPARDPEPEFDDDSELADEPDLGGFEDDDDGDAAGSEQSESSPAGLWDRVGEVHPGFTYALVLSILVGFAAQLTSATVGVSEMVAGRSLVGPFVTAGAALRAPFLEGEWWRLFSPVFLHANLLHLGSNLLALVIVGGVVERAFGHARFLVLFTAAAALGSLATFEHQRLLGEAASGSLGSIGASGAVYGVGAAVVAAAIRLRGLLSPWRARALIGATLPLLLSSLAGGFVRPGTDNAAHLGGAVCGAVLGFLLPLHAELQTGKESGTSRALWAMLGLVGLSALVTSAILAYLHGAADVRQGL